MINDKKVLAVIPARGGSKGVKKKNIRRIEGRPLVSWTIEAAKNSKYIDRLILSSEDPEIIKECKLLGCDVPFERPRELALDETDGILPVLHAIDMLKHEDYDYVILLQPTSPLRLSQDIDGALEFCINENHPACISVAEVEQSPHWMFSVNPEGKMTALIKGEAIGRRQDLPKYYSANGAVYIADVKWLKEKRTFITNDTAAFLMPKLRSLDIDSEIDISLLSCILKAGKHNG